MMIKNKFKKSVLLQDTYLISGYIALTPGVGVQL